MPMDKYMIVNATQLDTDLASIANTIKTKLNEPASKEYEFPEDFSIAINKMQYDANPNTVDDLQVNGKTITATAGYYQNNVSKSVATGRVVINELKLTAHPTVTLSADKTKIVAKYTVEQEPQVSIAVPGYITSTEIENNKFSATGETSTPIADLFTVNTADKIVKNADGTITIPAGYYAADIVYTIPTA